VTTDVVTTFSAPVAQPPPLLSGQFSGQREATSFKAPDHGTDRHGDAEGGLMIEPVLLGLERRAAAVHRWSAIMNARVAAPRQRYERRFDASRDGQIRQRQNIELFGMTVWISVIVALLTLATP
jgi:hypothetical protein